MAIINSFERIILERDIKHSLATASYSIIETKEGRFLQIDTYGSSERKIVGKKSQSIRFSSEAAHQLRKILEKYFL